MPVKLGKAESVSAVPAEETSLLVDKAQRNSVTTEIALEAYVTAPVSRGQRLGTLTVKAGEQVIAQVPLVAETEVTRLTTLDLMGKILRRIAMAKE